MVALWVTTGGGPSLAAPRFCVGRACFSASRVSPHPAAARLPTISPGTVMNVVWFFQMLKGLAGVLAGKGEPGEDDKRAPKGASKSAGDAKPALEKKRQ